MFSSLFSSFLQRLTPRWPLILYAVTWTTLLTVTVVVASFSPEVAFVSAISSASPFSRDCVSEGYVRIPIDVPGEVVCLPLNMFLRSKMDLAVPPVFAAVVVVGSAFVVKAFGLWEEDERR